MNFSEPTKLLDALMRERRITHDGDPVLAWCMGNVVGHYDARSNVYPKREDPGRKIDCAVATIMALGVSISDEAESSGYIYRDRDLMVFWEMHSMPNHEHYDFRTLRGWLRFCREAQYASEAEFAHALMCEAQSASPRWKDADGPDFDELMPPDPEYVDEIEHAVRLLVSALCNYRDAVPLANLWLAHTRCPWRLVPEAEARHRAT